MTPTGSILVVDDDSDICRNLSDILTDLGYHVDTATDGPAAIELVRRNPYDVALLDLKMPGMNGLEVYRAIRRLRASTVALIVTAYASQATAEEAIQAGAWRVVPKPVDLPGLLSLVKEALGQPLVLVVDDDADLCATLWDLLRERSYRVGIAHDPARAAEQLRGARFQVVLIDMRLPGGDGGDVFRVARECNPQTRTVVITGHPAEMNNLVQDVVRAGADAVCYKPFDVPKLLDVLAELSRRRGGKSGAGSGGI
jgi:two-component system response regulator HydG